MSGAGTGHLQPTGAVTPETATKGVGVQGGGSTLTSAPRLDGPAPSATLTVGSVPAGHVYVRHLEPVSGTVGASPRVVRLPDPHPDHPDRPATDRWWPPRMLDPQWVRTHDLDVLHVHFGYDDRSPAELAGLVAALAERRVPLVLTVHDLRNPHHDDPALLPAQLDVLLPAAAAVITLTDGAARELADRWGVAATVLPHPHVVPLDDIARLRRTPSPGRRARLGLSAKSLRRNCDPLRLLPALVATARSGRAEIVVDLHHDVYDAPPTPYAVRLRRALDDAAAAGDVQLWVHDRLSDEELWRHLAGLDAIVLPYRFGTHSGWLEAAHDLGVRVVAPSSGHYAGQDADHVYTADEDAVDLDSLQAALAAASVPRPIAPAAAYIAQRRVQRDALAAAHEEIYARVVGR